MAFSHGVKIHQTTKLVEMNCFLKECPHIIQFTRQLCTGLGKPFRITFHLSDYLSRKMNSSTDKITAVHTSKQVACLLLCNLQTNHRTSSRNIKDKVHPMLLYSLHPHLQHCRAVRPEIYTSEWFLKSFPMAARVLSTTTAIKRRVICTRISGALK